MQSVAAAHTQYDDLYHVHQRRVLRLCRLMLADPDEAADVSQDVFLKLFREQQMHPGDRDAEAWAAWLTLVAVNACRDRRRSRWWKLRRQGSDDPEEAGLPSAGPSPEDKTLSRETGRHVWRALRSLSARQQEVFVLRYIEGWPTAQVAETLELNPGSVKRHLYRAVQQLRAALRGYR